MERCDRRATFARERDAVLHQRSGDAAATPCRVHGNRGDQLRGTDFPPKYWPAGRSMYPPTTSPSMCASRSGAYGSAAVIQSMLCAALPAKDSGVDLRKTPAFGVTLRFADLDGARP